MSQSVRQALDVCWQSRTAFRPLAPTLPIAASSCGAVLPSTFHCCEVGIIHSVNGCSCSAGTAWNSSTLEEGWRTLPVRLVVLPWNDQNLASPMSARDRWLSLLGVTAAWYQLPRSRYDEIVSTEADAQVGSRKRTTVSVAVAHRVLKYLFPILHVITGGPQFLLTLHTCSRRLHLLRCGCVAKRCREESAVEQWLGRSSSQGASDCLHPACAGIVRHPTVSTTFRRTGSGGSIQQ